MEKTKDEVQKKWTVCPPWQHKSCYKFRVNIICCNTPIYFKELKIINHNIDILKILTYAYDANIGLNMKSW